MVFRGTIGHRSYLLSLRPASLTLAQDEADVWAWDAAGRLYSVHESGRTYRRGLNGSVLAKWDANGVRHRERLEADACDALVAGAAHLAHDVRDAIAEGRWQWGETPRPGERTAVVAMLDRCTRFDGATARADARRFHDVYRPVGILPPDQYLATLLQATEGCSFGTCTFCDLYHDRYRVKNEDEFREHIVRVRAFLGESARLRSRGIFLGSANALAVPMTRLVPLLQEVAEAWGTSRPPVHAFVDGFTGERKSMTDYQRLAALGLRRVYIGLESGHDPLLAFVRKPATGEAVIATVRALKDAGLQAAIIVMLGLGGDRFADGHVTDTAAVLASMPLGHGDLIYFSDLVPIPDTPYPGTIVRAGIRPLTAEERAAQRHAILDRLRWPGPAPQVATYDVREFVY